jgi:hypothetical protein
VTFFSWLACSNSSAKLFSALFGSFSCKIKRF